MVLFNYSTKEITAKIVYYGPGLCGKTTNLQYIFDNLPPNIHKGKMLSLATKTDRTLFFDFLPIDLGTIRGMRTRLQLYTVPGQVFYNTTRKLVLKGADGIVFVADSQKRLLDADIESFGNLEQNLEEHGMKLSEMPHILQFNKRDLDEILACEDMNAALNRYNAPIYEAVATTGIGVQDTLKAVTRLVLNSLKEKYGDARRHSSAEPAVVTAASHSVPAAVAAAPAREPVRTPAPEPVLDLGGEIPAEPILEEVPVIEPIADEEPAAAETPVLDIEEEPAAREPEEAVLAAEEEPVLSLEEPEEPVLAEVIEEAPPDKAAAAAEPLVEPVAVEEVPVLEAEPGEEAPEAPQAEEEPIAEPAAEEEILIPLPVAPAEPFEVEATTVEPSGPVLAEPAPVPLESPAGASFETRAVPLAGPGERPGEASHEATFPFVINVEGQTLHLRVTVTVRVERP